MLKGKQVKIGIDICGAFCAGAARSCAVAVYKLYCLLVKKLVIIAAKWAACFKWPILQQQRFGPLKAELRFQKTFDGGAGQEEGLFGNNDLQSLPVYLVRARNGIAENAQVKIAGLLRSLESAALALHRPAGFFQNIGRVAGKREVEITGCHIKILAAR